MDYDRVKVCCDWANHLEKSRLQFRSCSFRTINWAEAGRPHYAQTATKSCYVGTPRLSEDKVKQRVDSNLNVYYPPKAIAKMAAFAALCVQYMKLIFDQTCHRSLGFASASSRTSWFVRRQRAWIFNPSHHWHTSLYSITIGKKRKHESSYRGFGLLDHRRIQFV